MSQIHIARHGQSLGAFTEEEVKAGIQSQRFVGEDLSWRSGMSEWRPLEETAAAWGLDATSEQSSTNENELPLLMEPAWERRAELGFLKALIQTVKAVLLKPKTTFSKLKVEGGFWNPLSYYLFMSLVATGVSLCYQMPSILQNPKLLSAQLDGVSHRSLIIGTIILWIVSPLFFAVGIFITSFLMHLSLKLVARTKEPFQATLRTMSYAIGSVSIVQFVPVVGGIVSIIWGIITYSIGLKKVHRISAWRLFFAIILSFILLVVFYAMIILIASVAMTYLSHAPLEHSK